MSFEPEPGTRINLGTENIQFIPLEPRGPTSVFVYAESGREGIVYKVSNGRQFYALKVFYPQLRDKRLLETTEKLSRFKELEGFRVAERKVIDQETHPRVVNEHPDLNYAVLMPWIEGTVWGNLMIDTDAYLHRGSYFQIVQALARVVCNLESQGLAHCDLSNNNFLIAPDYSSIQLVDIENMYAPGMPHPTPDISYGTIGYRTPWIAEHGLWGPDSDRFAFAILCSEICTWHNKEIRENKAESSSFFAEDEIGEICERYTLMIKYLGDLNQRLAILFEQAWRSKDASQCPSVSQWMHVIQNMEVQPSIHAEPEPVDANQLQIKTLVIKKISETVSSGLPPKMEISHEIIDFGTLDTSDLHSEFYISNTGGSALIGEITSESWLEAVPQQFAIQPGEQQAVQVRLRATSPKPKSGLEYRTASALTVDSNIGTEVIGTRYKLQKPPFYNLAWARVLAGTTLGLIILLSCICLIAAAFIFSRQF
jgi:serine/threonine protein kinase